MNIYRVFPCLYILLVHIYTYAIEPITISQPGYANFATTLQFTVTTTGQACITIDANDVIVDFNNFSLSLDESSIHLDVTGIRINPQVRNIEIKNGSITGMTEYGIYISDGTDTIQLVDMIIHGAKKAGVIFDGSTEISNVFCTNLSIENIVNTEGNATYGLLLKNVSIAELTKCYVTHTITTTGNCYGVTLQNCKGSILDSIISNEHQGGGLETAAFFLDNTDSCIVKNCFAIHNTSTSSDPNAVVMGFYYNASENHFLESCIAVGNTSPRTCIGFKIQDGVGIQLIGCDAFANSSSGLDGIGFFSSGGIATQLKECEAKGNSGANNGYGVLFNDDLLSFAIEDCDIRLDTGMTGTSFGIYIETATAGYINHNTIIGHVGGTTGYGIFDSADASTTNLIVGNTAIKNTVNFSPGSPTIPIYSGGFSGTPGPFENISL